MTGLKNTRSNIILHNIIGWEFTLDSGTSYTGYYIQAFLLRMASLLGYSAAWIFGVNCIVPYFLLLLTIFGIGPAKLGTQGLYIATEDSRQELIHRLLCFNNPICIKVCGISVVGYILLITFAVCGSVYAWGTHHYFSLYDTGDSYEMISIVFLSYLMFGVWMIYVSFKLDSIQTYVEDMHDFASNLFINNSMHSVDTAGQIGAQIMRDDPDLYGNKHL